MPEHIEWKTPAPGLWLRHFRLGEWLGDPVTPLFKSWLLEQLDEQIYTNFKRTTHIPTPKPYHVIVNGWYYATGNFLPKGPLHAMWLAFRHLIPGMILRPQQLSILFTANAHWGMKFYEREWREIIAPGYRQIVDSGWTRVEHSDPSELIRLIDEVARAAGENFYSFIAVGGSAWKPEMRLAAFYRKYLLPSIGKSHLSLLQGLDTKSSVPGDHAVLSLDWYHQTLGELELSRKNETDLTRKAGAELERQECEQEARNCLYKKPKLLHKFESLLAIARESSIVREEQAVLLTLGWPLMRRAIRELGNYLLKQHIIEKNEDIFFMTKQELQNTIEKCKPIDNLLMSIAKRRQEWQRERRLTPPAMIGKMSFIARRIFGGVERSFGVNAQEADAHVLKGIPASPGKATGPVRIIRTPEEFRRLQPGDVLVAPVTNPAWTPLFANAAAVITDIGSIMAHASLVAREYGIPAIIGTGDATSRLHDSQIVTVDGNTGIIELHG